MKTALLYLLEANLYLALFYGLYRVLFYRLSFYTVNRAYLLIAMLASFALPMIQLQITGTGPRTTTVPTAIPGVMHTVSVQPASVGQQARGIWRWSWANPLTCCYVAIASILLIRVLNSIFRIVKLRRTLPIVEDNDIKISLIPGEHEAFSFFRWLFVSAPITTPIVEHERAHSRQLHSLDLLFTDLFFALNWFNPLVSYLRRDIRLNHEFLADRSVTRRLHLGKRSYAHLLIEHAGPALAPSLHGFSSGMQLRERIGRLGKQSSWVQLFRYFGTIPLVAAVLLLSATCFPKDYGWKPGESNQSFVNPKLLNRPEFVPPRKRAEQELPSPQKPLRYAAAGYPAQGKTALRQEVEPAVVYIEPDTLPKKISLFDGTQGVSNRSAFAGSAVTDTIISGAYPSPGSKSPSVYLSRSGQTDSSMVSVSGWRKPPSVFEQVP